MQITIEIKCPTCLSDSIKKNGIKVDGKQNYQCKDCKRQFIGDHALSYLGCNSGITRKILQLMVRGSGIRDIAEVERISIGKVLRTLTESAYQIQPKHSHYESLEVDEFWTFVGNKNNKQWLIYAYHRETGEIVAYVWGKRDLATVQRLKTKLKQLGIHYTRIASDHWDSFITAFKNCKQSIGKLFTVGIEGNNCKISHRISRGFIHELTVGSNDEMILESIVHLAIRLGLVVTAEGVESPLQMEILSRLGCQQLQGYLLGMPMDVKRLEEFEYTSSTYFN